MRILYMERVASFTNEHWRAASVVVALLEWLSMGVWASGAQRVWQSAGVVPVPVVCFAWPSQPWWGPGLLRNSGLWVRSNGVAQSSVDFFYDLSQCEGTRGGFILAPSVTKWRGWLPSLSVDQMKLTTEHSSNPPLLLWWPLPTFLKDTERRNDAMVGVSCFRTGRKHEHVLYSLQQTSWGWPCCFQSVFVLEPTFTRSREIAKYMVQQTWTLHRTVGSNTEEVASVSDEKLANKAAEWNPGFSIKHQTYRPVRRPEQEVGRHNQWFPQARWYRREEMESDYAAAASGDSLQSRRCPPQDPTRPARYVNGVKLGDNEMMNTVQPLTKNQTDFDWFGLQALSVVLRLRTES